MDKLLNSNGKTAQKWTESESRINLFYITRKRLATYIREFVAISTWQPSGGDFFCCKFKVVLGRYVICYQYMNNDNLFSLKQKTNFISQILSITFFLSFLRFTAISAIFDLFCSRILNKLRMWEDHLKISQLNQRTLNLRSGFWMPIYSWRPYCLPP